MSPGPHRFIVAAQREARLARWRFRSMVRGRWRRIRSALANASASSSPAPNPSPPSPPVFDLQAYNPIGWRRDHTADVAALGALQKLPPTSPANRVLRYRDLHKLRRVHHLEDVAAFHTDVFARANRLIRAAAAGVVVHLADVDERLRPLLGERLFNVMKANIAGLDTDAREQRSIELRRTALREHSSWCRAHSDNQPPPVSILLATRRPSFLPWALANVAKQTYPRLELILALHGDGFPDLSPHLANLPQPAKVLRAEAAEPLGAVLELAAQAASGTLLTKMDDDDAYGAEHIWDLVLARQYSSAQLVGKWLEFIHLGTADRTMRWFNGGGERYYASALAGGTLLIACDDLRHCGGWRRIPSGVDTALAEDVLRAGGCAYRAHATGFMLIRHGRTHTWQDDDATETALLARANRTWPGFQPQRASIEPNGLPHPGLARTPPDNEADGTRAQV